MAGKTAMLGYVGNGRIGLVGQKPHRLGHTAVADIVAEALAKALVENTRQVGTVEWHNGLNVGQLERLVEL